MKYESDILKRLINTYGVVGNPRYISEIIKEFIVRGKERFPNLFAYQADWLAHIDEFGLNPSYTVSYTGQSIYAPNTLERPVKRAILKGQTLNNLADLSNLSQQHFVITKNNNEIILSRGNYTNYPSFKIDIPNGSADKKYTVIYKCKVNQELYTFGIGFTNNNLSSAWNGAYNKNTFKPTTSYKTYSFISSGDKSLGFSSRWSNYPDDGTIIYFKDIIVVEGEYDVNNIDIPCFVGMQSVQMPVLTTTGKNLNPTRIEPSGLYDSTGTNRNDPSQCRTDDFINVTPNQVLTVSSDQQINRIFGYDADGNYLGIGNGGNILSYGLADKKEHTFTVPNNCYKIKITSFVNTNTYFQLEEGTIATPYEPYKTNILTVNKDVELGSIGEVKDELNLLTGQLTQRTEVRAYQKGDESNSEVLTDMTNTRYKLPKEVIKTVDLTILDQNNQNVEQLMSFNGGTHFNTASSEGSLLPMVSVSVETDLEAILKVCSLDGNTM